MVLSKQIRPWIIAQALVVPISLGLAEFLSRGLQLDRAGGVMCLASLASL